MNTSSRTLSFHVAGLVLAAPLFLLWFHNPDERVAGPEIFGLLVVAAVYAFVALKARPASIYDSAQRMGVTSRGLQFLILTVASVMISIPFLDSDSQIGPLLGLGILIASATLYALALGSTLFSKE